MKPKPAILSVLGRDDLKHIVDDLEIDGVDRRSVEAMRAKLSRARRVTAEDLLAYMRKDEAERSRLRETHHLGCSRLRGRPHKLCLGNGAFHAPYGSEARRNPFQADTLRSQGNVMDLSRAILTEHAAGQMARRQLAEADVRRVLTAPEEVLPVRPGRVVAQALIGSHLVRVFVDVDRTPAEVVTAYRTSKIEKYRSRP